MLWPLCKAQKNSCVQFQETRSESRWLAIFWDVVLCSLLKTDRRFIHAYSLHHGASQQPGRQPSSYQLLWEFEISLRNTAVSSLLSKATSSIWNLACPASVSYYKERLTREKTFHFSWRLGICIWTDLGLRVTHQTILTVSHTWCRGTLFSPHRQRFNSYIDINICVHSNYLHARRNQVKFQRKQIPNIHPWHLHTPMWYKILKS
jgi:hypothetical protein